MQRAAKKKKKDKQTQKRKFSLIIVCVPLKKTLKQNVIFVGDTINWEELFDKCQINWRIWEVLSRSIEFVTINYCYNYHYHFCVLHFFYFFVHLLWFCRILNAAWGRPKKKKNKKRRRDCLNQENTHTFRLVLSITCIFHKGLLFRKISKYSLHTTGSCCCCCF